MARACLGVYIGMSNISQINLQIDKLKRNDNKPYSRTDSSS